MSAPASDVIMQWAVVGSRISGFHHDSASKLQSMMMALDEATELVADERPDVARALETAMTGLRELHALLTDNRALAKAPQRKHMALADVLGRAAARSGVKLRGEIGTATVFVGQASMTHAIALLCDTLGGPLQGARTVDIIVTASDDRVEVALKGAPPAASTLDAITVATWLIEREEGAVFSAPSGFQLQLPIKARSDGANP